MEITKNNQIIECTYKTYEERSEHVNKMIINGWSVDSQCKLWVGHNVNPFDQDAIENAYIPFGRFTRTDVYR